MNALAEAETFLWRYPQALTDLDDPIEIIRTLFEATSLHQEEIDRVDAREEELETRIKSLEVENVQLRVLVIGLQKRLGIPGAVL